MSFKSASPKRAVIYARYSSDEQRPESIEDQILKCRRYCDGMGSQVVGTYSDAAITGSTILRPEYQRLLQDAECGQFDIVVVEAVDRLSRRLADLANFHDIVGFRKVRLFATDRGEINGLMIGILGAMAQAFLEDLKGKTKRGLTGKILAGLSAGSLGYGYRVHPETKGKRLIIEDEAKVVRRIFEDYANGVSPRALAAQLNAEGVPGPRGREWIDTTIRGQVDRGTGLLNNELYTGRLVWNRTSYVRDPSTGKRLARPNPKEEWEVSSDESLRIIDDALWQRVKAQQTEVRTAMTRDDHGVPLNRAHRAQHLLSGLIVCGDCGSTFAMRDAGHYGCSNVRSKGTCANVLKVKRADLERLIGNAIRHRWMNEDAMARLRADLLNEREKAVGVSDEIRGKLVSAIKRKHEQVTRIVNAIADAGHNPALLSKLDQIEAELGGLRTELDRLEAAEPPAPLEITDDVDALIQAAARDIEQAISGATHPDAPKHREMVRRMIDRITISRHESGAIEVGVRGAFAGVMQAAGLVERHALRTKKPSDVFPSKGFSIVGCGGPQPT
ncbi:recombinase family protein [Lichenifustis flavocetrariae]|uniref:Recombinase family protein n=1 Tax=Lichenifustis flavocetrariae TaxID=2949735 RepID=A0AA41ZBN1_9HYPH|nr:recombinase family protein [Lichenifustis flavocetrariae]MCW6512912.1 recombinase family protein [Lichenifustis flavocetrariae]